MRPMILAFPDDETAKYLDREYMFGPSILVAPVMSADGVCRYYLPEGRWYHILSGEVEEGAGWKKWDGSILTEAGWKYPDGRVQEDELSKLLSVKYPERGITVA